MLRILPTLRAESLANAWAYRKKSERQVFDNEKTQCQLGPSGTSSV